MDVGGKVTQKFWGRLDLASREKVADPVNTRPSSTYVILPDVVVLGQTYECNSRDPPATI